MHYLPYTNSRCLTNTATRFGASRHHLQGVPSLRLNSQHVKWIQTTVRPCRLFWTGKWNFFFR